MTLAPWLIIFIGVLFRMLGLSRPLLGHFSMYQTANAMMARSFLEHHFTNLLYPQVNVLVNGKPGYLLLAYPLNAVAAAVLKTLLGGSLDLWGRFQSVLFFAAAAIFLYRLCVYFLDKRLAFASLVLFCLNPLTIVYGQSFQNEMITLCFSLTFIYYAAHYLDTNKFLPLILSAFSLSLVLITRPNNLFLMLPFAYLCFMGKETLNRISRGVMVLALAVVIPALWFFHLWKVSHEVNNIYSTLFAQVAVRSSFVSPLIFSLDYYQKLLDTVSGMGLTPLGFALFFIGLLLSVQTPKRYGLFWAWGIAFWASSLLIPRKLIDHDFYLLHFLPAAMPLMALTTLTILDQIKKYRRSVTAILASVTFALALRYALHPAFKTTKEDEHLLEIAQEIQKVTSKDSDKIIIQGSHPALYYADRYGWTFTLKRSGKISDYYTQTNWEKLPEDQWKKRNEAFKDAVAEVEYRRSYDHATHFVVINPKEFYSEPSFASYMHEHFKPVYEKKNVAIIFKLTY